MNTRNHRFAINCLEAAQRRKRSEWRNFTEPALTSLRMAGEGDNPAVALIHQGELRAACALLLVDLRAMSEKEGV